jgi:hypothetical protein
MRSAWGQSRRFVQATSTSASPSIPDVFRVAANGRNGPTADLNGSAHDVAEVLILLQKSARSGCGIKQATIELRRMDF